MLTTVSVLTICQYEKKALEILITYGLYHPTVILYFWPERTPKNAHCRSVYNTYSCSFIGPYHRWDKAMESEVFFVLFLETIGAVPTNIKIHMLMMNKNESVNGFLCF
ncbi:hypothetical protein Tcan_00864, partial [Toxocara canis]